MAKDDGDLWRIVARSVTPLAGKSATPSPIKTSRPQTPKTKPATKKLYRRQSRAKPLRQNTPANLDKAGYGGISAGDARRLKSGRYRIAARIDLHGMTLNEARRALARFIVANRDEQKPVTLLVITGKGRLGQGVIREHLPRWLIAADIAPAVIAFCHASPQDGGAGAFYVRLRGARS